MLTPEQLPDTLRSLITPQAQPSLIPPAPTQAPEEAADTATGGAPGTSAFGNNPLMRMALEKAGYLAPQPPQQQQGSFGKALGKTLDNTPVPPEPGGWAKSIVAGAQKVLSGVGDISTEPSNQPGSPFGSFVEGLAQTGANRANRQAKEQQVNFAQQRELTKEQQEQQKLDQDKKQSEAIIAYNNSERIHMERLTHQLGDSEIENSIKDDASYRKELEEDGAQEHYKDKTWGEIQQIMSTMKGDEPNHPITLVPIATGRRVVGEETDAQGRKSPTYATTYSLYDAPQKSTINEDQAKRFNEATNPATPYKAGDQLYGHQINTLQTTWKSKQIDDAGIQKALTESLGEKQTAKILEEMEAPGFDQKFHDAAVAAGGYTHPDKIADELSKKGVADAEQIVATHYGGQTGVDAILNQNTQKEIEDKKAQVEADKLHAALTDQTDIFGNQAQMKDSDFQKRYTQFTNSKMFTNLQQLDGSYSEYQKVQKDIADNGGNISGPDALVGLFNAIGITAEPVKGAGLRINKNVIDEHINSRGLVQSGYAKLQGLKSGALITTQQLNDYAKIASDVYKHQYIAAADEQLRTLHYIDIMPRGNSQTIDPTTMDIFMTVSGNNPLLAATAAQKNGWVINPSAPVKVMGSTFPNLQAAQTAMVQWNAQHRQGVK